MAKPGNHEDGDGLRLVVGERGGKKWVLRFSLAGKRREMGLGSFPEVGLADARNAAFEARKLVASGVDPIEARNAEKKAKARAGKPIPTFNEIAAEVVKDAQAESTNAKVRYQWERHLGEVYSGPLLKRPVNEITSSEVAALAKPLLASKPEVGRKWLSAIRRVFDRARVVLKDEFGVVMVENPANVLDLRHQGVPKPRHLSRGHHPALPFTRMAEFMTELRRDETIAAKVLEFTILTNIRTESVIEAEWSEFDLKETVWIIPIEKMKDRKHRTMPFRVPLSARVIELLEEVKVLASMLGRDQKLFVFPGQKAGRPLSNMCMLTLLKKMDDDAPADRKWIDPLQKKRITVHGFRSTFKVWAEETTSFPRNTVEEAMGHVVGSGVEQAYRRTDVLERRRKLMDEWATFCEPVKLARKDVGTRAA
jgi:integrase